MSAATTMLAAAAEAIRDADADELPAIVGELEALKAVAWSRMLAPPPPARDEGGDQNVSADEAARRLGLSKDWLYKHADALPFAVKIGRRVLFSARGLERWNRQRTGQR